MAAIFPEFPYMLHGGDYNPDQWLDRKDILAEDDRLMKLAHVNALTVAVFAWQTLEPEEGKFDFSWLDDVFARAEKNGQKIILATPSAVPPRWLAHGRPEVVRTDRELRRLHHNTRQVHCYTAPIYREKTCIINQKLAERYSKHPALLAWHISNEFFSDCHCPLCQEAFRDWLKARYDQDLMKLNRAWWQQFWSHDYTDWSQIESPSALGEWGMQALNLNWRRFVTHQMVDFMKHELAPIRELSPGTPCTTNFMGSYVGLNYRAFAPHLDVISNDSYPQWHVSPELDLRSAIWEGFHCDLMRSMKQEVSPESTSPENFQKIKSTDSLTEEILPKSGLRHGKPWLLMECTPSSSNGFEHPTLKRPGMHLLSSLLRVAFGADSVLYFQWRSARGNIEKFHGTVVSHDGRSDTRVFREVAELGAALEKLQPVVGSVTPAEVAIIYDWECAWAFDDCSGLGNKKQGRYQELCRVHYQSFLEQGIPVDLIGMDDDWTGYKLLVAPLLYLLQDGVAARLEAFVQAGGHFVTSYLSGLVDKDDLCFEGGFPGPLRDLLGIRVEETDCLPTNKTNTVLPEPGNNLSLKDSYEALRYCDLLHAEGPNVQVLARFGADFYAGSPALTRNVFGKGAAYYIAFHHWHEFSTDFYEGLSRELSLQKDLPTPPPSGVLVRTRQNLETGQRFLFLLNFNTSPCCVNLGGISGTDLLTNTRLTETAVLSAYGACVLQL